MPICNKPPPALGNIKSATEIDDHASEAAKVKRTREQAYFNSYNFDAIEALPYDDDDDDEDERAPATADAALSYHNNNHASNPPTTVLHTLNANSRQRPPHASLSSKSHSSSSDRSSGRLSGSQRSYNGLNTVADYAGLHSDNAKYAYLQRLGTLLVRPQHAAPSECGRAAALTLGEDALAHSISQVNLQQETVDNGSFLLPRAMLKYQSVGSTNSMPLAVIATLHATGPAAADQLLLNGNSGSGSQATVMLTSNSNDNDNRSGSGSGSRNSHIAITSATNAATRPNGKIRLNYANSNDNYSCLLMAANKDTKTATTSALTATSTGTTAAAAAARIKKQSTSSTATASSGSAEHELPSQQSAGVRGRNSNSATALATAAAEGARRGRTSSHQSHYSTDKSGSSGYYSSNVCSTYSLEDHIYSEPVIDVLDVSSKSKSGIGGQSQSQSQPQSKHITTTNTTTTKTVQSTAAAAGEMQRNSRVRDMNDAAPGKRYAFRAANGGVDLARGCADDAADDEGDDEDGAARGASRKVTPGLQVVLRRKSPPRQPPAQHFSENLRILETSIENLDRHLKNFPSLSSQERIAAFVQSHHTYLQLPGCADAGERLARAHSHLPTIMEGYDPANQPRPWPDDMVDDSLLDIDLDSFLLVDERRASKRDKPAKTPAAGRRRSDGGIDNPNFLTDEQEENNYKCVKYINSCPEDAYRVESDIVAGNGIGTGTGSGSEKSISLVDHYLKRYEDQLHFQSTRELLEDVRDKIRLLSQSRNSGDGGDLHANSRDDSAAHSPQLPIELESMIKTLKLELETYLNRMNQHSELEIRQLCSGLVKNQNIVKMKKAFERRRSAHSIGAVDSDYGYAGAYEAVGDGALLSASSVPLSIREHIASIRCASDPNFKMKRKSLAEVFPGADCGIEPTEQRRSTRSERLKAGAIRVMVQLPHTSAITTAAAAVATQMQRNLSFQQPILNKLDAKAGVTATGSSVRIELGGRAVSSGDGGGGSGGSGAESAESGDKDSILEWHRKKPSIWEMYYGTNRMNQSLLGKRNGMVVNSSQATMSYPSSRPESDFTLDLPRAEQLRIKMEKEKKFRQRCRYITTLLSLVFFLLTVMVVSLVLTRGKRMFGSMI